VEKRTRNRDEISAEAKKLARERALVILQVRSGMLTASEGAQRLGVSRKTYYEWEERALEAMALALENRPIGRPPASMDEEKEDLRRQIRELEKKLDLAEKTIEVKELLTAYDSFKDVGSKKNKTRRRQTGRKR
jgi:transposase